MLSENQRTWWVRPEDEIEDVDLLAHEKLHAIIEELERVQDRKRSMLIYGAMYGGGLAWLQGRSSTDSAVRMTPGSGSKGSMSLNVSRNVVDAVCARVFSKSRPRMSYVSEGGGYEKQHDAEQLTAGVDGSFYQTDYYDKATDKGRDGCVFGTGFTRTRPNFDSMKVEVERRFPWEVLYDDTEAVFGDPRSMFLSYYVDRAVLAHRVKIGWYADGTPEQCADLARRVERVSGQKDSDAEFGYQQVALRVKLEEGYHRPSGKDANDGRYTVGIPGAFTLIDRPWDGGPGNRWEVSSYRWSKPIAGFYGQGIVEIGSPIQSEINKLARQIQAGQHLITGHWLVEQGSKVALAHIQNDLSAILRYTGTPPAYVAPTIIAPEMYQHLWNLVAKYYELAGVNQQAAQAQKPIGLDSGEAQRVYADQQTETLLEKGQRFEQCVKEDGQLHVDAAQALAKKGAYEVRAMADDGFETIDWKQLPDPNGFEIRVHPTSQLPGTPSGKISLAQDLMAVGDFDPGDLMEIVGMPDILQLTRRKQSTRKLVEKKIGLMLRDGVGYEPTPLLQPFAATIAIATEMHNLAELKEVDDDRLQLVRDFIAKCQKLDTQAQAQMRAMFAPPPPPPPIGVPPGMPPRPPGMPPPNMPPPQGAAPPPH